MIHHDFSRFFENRAHRLLNPATRALVFRSAAAWQSQYPPSPASQGLRNSTLAAAVLLPWKYYIRSLTRSHSPSSAKSSLDRERDAFSLSLSLAPHTRRTSSAVCPIWPPLPAASLWLRTASNCRNYIARCVWQEREGLIRASSFYCWPAPTPALRACVLRNPKATHAEFGWTPWRALSHTKGRRPKEMRRATPTVATLAYIIYSVADFVCVCVNRHFSCGFYFAITGCFRHVCLPRLPMCECEPNFLRTHYWHYCFVLFMACCLS